MRIHTDNIEAVHVALCKATSQLPGVWATVSRHGSRSHAGALEFSLTGNGYRKNTGTRGASDDIGATWDEWGVAFAAIFTADPEALAGSVKHPTYDGADDFHRKTGYRFSEDGLPDDTHKRHNWQFGGMSQGDSCTKCTAVRRS